jgi:MoaA/NifB/PqqE/SkfB family radical SAM enzyme
LDAGVRPPSTKSLDARAFFSALDRFQRDAFRCLRLRYPEQGADSFCKLVALKTANALALDYHFRNRHTVLTSRPPQLQVDPSNACHLRCPSCLHSAKADWALRFDWPSATLSVEEFDRFCGEFAPFATGLTLFRDGEPLLHRRFPEFVTLAKSYLAYTLTSTSLSMPLDAESLVASGLDRLVAAIDGASAATYNRYRRGGDFELVIGNLRAIVCARKAQSSAKPWLVWQFLAFEHNVHEVDAAARLCQEIGIDQLLVSRPHAVEHDDPSIKVAEEAPFGETLFSEPGNWCTAAERASVTRNAERIGTIFSESWADRYHAIGTGDCGSRSADSICRWLYYNLTMDAARRITPCCLPPMGPPQPRHLVYAQFNGNNTGEVINSLGATLARRQCRSGRRGGVEAQKQLPYCVTCKENPQPPMWPDVAGYLLSVDERRALPESVHAALAESPLFARPPQP